MTRTTRLAPGPLVTAVVAAGALAAVAVVAIAIAPNGPGLSVDSASYELAANSFDGARALVPLVLNDIFPPGYPATIAAAQTVTPEARDAAVLVNQVALAATVCLVAAIVWWSRRDRDSGLSRAVVPVVAAGLVATAPAMLRWTGYVMAEQLSIALTMVAVGAAARALDGPRAWLVTAAVAAGAAGVVRHGALSVVAAVVLAVLLASRGSWRARVAQAGATAVLAGTTWLAGSWILLGRRPGSGRALAWHPPGWGDAIDALDTLAAYWVLDVVPTALARAIVALALMAGVGATVLAMRRTSSPTAWHPVALVAGLAAIGHVLALIASKAWVDDAIVADDRLLLPLLPLVVVTVATWVPLPRSRPLALTALGVVAVVAAAQLEGTAEWVRESRRDGIEYGARRFADSPTLSATRSLPADIVVWSNEVALLSLRADRQSFPVPVPIDNYSGRAEPTYEADLVALAGAIDDGAVAVYVDAFPDGRRAQVDDLLAVDPDLPVERFADGAIVGEAAP